MGKKRHSLGSKVRPKKSKKKKVKKSKKKKYLIEADKLQLGIEDICSQLPDLNLVNKNYFYLFLNFLSA